jgi:hypothetical protein
VCVGLDELSNGKTIRGFVGSEGHVLAHEQVSSGTGLLRMAAASLR